MVEAFLHGMILAFGLILPLGVQNVFVFHQGATQASFIRTIPVVLTASICDTLLILLAVLGVSFIIFNIAWLKMFLLIIGIIFLVYMGWVTWRSAGVEARDKKPEALSPKKQIAFATSVSLLNPHAILDTVGVIGTSSIQYMGEDKWMFTAACILVSWVWFFGLALAGRMIGVFDTSGRWITRLNKFSAIIIWGVAIYLTTSLV